MATYREQMTVAPLDKRYLHENQARTIGPAGQSFSAAVYVWLGVGITCAWIGVPLRDGFYGTLLAGIVSAFVYWLYLQKFWLIGVAEDFTGWDLPGNDNVPQTSTSESVRPVRVNIEQVDDQGILRGGIYARFADENAMIALANAVIARRIPFSYAALVEKHHVLTRKEFETIRSEMLARKLVIERSEKFRKLGMVLTREGRGVLHDFLRTPLPH